MRKPGEECVLYYDTTLTVNEGDVIETSTRRRYLVMRARPSARTRNRLYLDVVVMAPDEPNPEEAVVHMLHWYSRRRKVG